MDGEVFDETYDNDQPYAFKLVEGDIMAALDSLRHDAQRQVVVMSDGRTIRLIRERDLIDPITGKDEWITLSTSDDPDTLSSDGNNVFEVHSTSTRLALDGKTHYNEWCTW